jgi:PAS domain S-box-containing protein
MAAVGTQIAVAIENARLYDIQRQTMDELTKSEGKYRRLFERASDAIWANDLSGQVTVANRAAVELMGDTVETMIGSDVRQFLNSEGLETARRVRRVLLAGQPLQLPYEQKLIRKDKSEVIMSRPFSSTLPAMSRKKDVCRIT